MCFVNEGDWHAEVCNEKDTVAEKRQQCDECGRWIAAGLFVHTVYMREHEMCQTCENNDCECPAHNPDDWHECSCAKPDLGETYSYCRCEACHKFLEGVQAAEEEAGCASWESRPMLGCMTEHISEQGAEEARKYYQAAVKLHPEIKGHLAWLWQQMFGL